jgi:drug/metabolite transporter (DMT)-like permease
VKAIDVIELLFLASVWGASFLFLRIASPEFGPIAVVELRILIGSVVLIPFIIRGNHIQVLLTRWRSIFILALISMVMPFPLFGYATLYANSGYVAVLNATTLMFASLIAYIWLKDRLGFYRLLGIVIGFCGIVILTFDEKSVDNDAGLLPTFAVLLAASLYGFTACYTRKFLLDLNPLIIVAGSQFFAAIILFPFAILTWPAESPSTSAWLSVTVLGILCTSLANLSYFRLVGRIGVTRAVTVTYLIPIFGIFWGYLFLDESITTFIILGCGLILMGVGFINKRGMG